MKKIAAGILTLSMALMVGCSKGTNSLSFMGTNNKAIVKVNDSVITQGMFDKIMGRISNGENKENVDQNKFIALIYKDRIVNDLIVRELLKQEAGKRHIEVNNSDLDKAVNDFAAKMGGKDKLFQLLKSKKVDKADFLSDIKLDLTAKKLVESLTTGLSVSDSDAKAFYEQSKNSKFKNPDQVRAEHILISSNLDEVTSKIKAKNPKIDAKQLDAVVQSELAKVKAKAEKIYVEAKANPSKFEALAKKYSEDPSSAVKGGDLGFFKAQDMVPEFSKAAFSTTPGQITGPVKSTFGYHIIKVTDRKRAGVTPYNEVKDEIKRFLGEQQKMMALQKLIESSKNTAVITYVDKQYDPKVLRDEIKKITSSQKQMMPAPQVEAKK